MGAAVAIGRLDMTASALRAAASREKDGAAARRIQPTALVIVAPLRLMPFAWTKTTLAHRSHNIESRCPSAHLAVRLG